MLLSPLAPLVVCQNMLLIAPAFDRTLCEDEYRVSNPLASFQAGARAGDDPNGARILCGTPD
jgi:hypothetical protein